jgi:hypothetical protein
MPSVSERSSVRDVEENVRLAQKLARELRNAQNHRRAFEISQQLAKVSRELEEATRIADELDKYDRQMRAAGY